MKHRIVAQPAFELVGWAHRATTAGRDNMNSIPKFWNDCHATGKVRRLASLSGPLGLFGLCTEMDRDHVAYTYLIGVEKLPGVTYPEGTQVFSLPEASYAVFSAIGPMPHALQAAWKKVFAEWLPSSGFEHAGTPDFELYPPFPLGDERGDPSSAKCVTELWISLRAKAIDCHQGSSLPTTAREG